MRLPEDELGDVVIGYVVDPYTNERKEPCTLRQALAVAANEGFFDTEIEAALKAIFYAAI